jgi:hypothetical protein
MRLSPSPRPVPVKCDRKRFGRPVPDRTGSPRRAAQSGLQVSRSHEAVNTARGDLPEAAYHALHAGRDVRGHFAGQRWEEPRDHEEVIPLGVA